MGIQAIGGILVDLDVVEHGDILGERANSNRVEVRGALEQLQRSHPLSPRSKSTPEGDVMELSNRFIVVWPLWMYTITPKVRYTTR